MTQVKHGQIDPSTFMEFRCRGSGEPVVLPGMLLHGVFERFMHFYVPTCDEFKQDLLTAAHPGRVLLRTEEFAKAYETYVAKHPEANGDESVLAKLHALLRFEELESDGEVNAELTQFAFDAWLQQWQPLQSFGAAVWPDFGRGVRMKFEEMVDVRPCGKVSPNLEYGVDYRHLLQAADIICGMDRKSGELHGFRGKECFDQDEMPRCDSLVVCVDMDTEDECQIQRVQFIVEMAKMPPEMV